MYIGEYIKFDFKLITKERKAFKAQVKEIIPKFLFILYLSSHNSVEGLYPGFITQKLVFIKNPFTF